MARYAVQKTQLFFFNGTALTAVECGKEIDLGQDSEEDIDTTCFDSAENTTDVGMMTPGEGSLTIAIDDENSSHLALLAHATSEPRQELEWFLGSSHSDDPPTVTGSEVTLPSTRTWWKFKGYLKAASPTFEKGQQVTYAFPLKRNTRISHVLRTIPAP